ncbi:hypothetical protein RCH20_001418 [Psychrobacter sp. PL15]|uniref:EpsG family protein n=1 Tax=Psychrobacter sp. PL15 TaxID=3071719 RepID=UPI002E034298|nr:hypothetical protein [Psychrobacter sp. PL15]
MLIDELTFFFSYNVIYFFTAFLVVTSILSVDFNRDSIRQKKIGSVLIFLPILSLILLIGLRDLSVGTDTYSYYDILWLRDIDLEFGNDFLFALLAKILRYFNLGYGYFLFLIAFLFMFTTYIALNKISKFYYSNILYLFFTYLSFFFFLSMSINIIRQGISLAFLLLAYSYFISKNNKSKVIIFIAFSLVFHSTSVIALILFFISNNKIKYIKSYHYYILFFLCIILSYMNFGLLNISPILIDIIGSDDRRTSYLSGESSIYIVGFKSQFVLFNSLFLLVASFLKTKIKNELWLSNYNVLIRYYILASCTFFMAFQIPYSDRWGLLSWYIIPLFFIPLFSCRYVKSSIKIHWVFLLILIFIGFRFYG